MVFLLVNTYSVITMLYSNDYSWFMNYNSSDILYLDETLNWDDSVSFTLVSYLPFLSIVTSYFANTHYSTDWLTVASVLDVVMFVEMLEPTFTTKLFSSTLLDLTLSLNSRVAINTALLFHSEYHDLSTTLFFNSPELLIPFNDFYTKISLADSMRTAACSMFDVYQDSPSVRISEFSEHLVLTPLFIITAVILLANFRITRLLKSLNAYVLRLVYYFFNYACDSRLQAEAVLESFFLAILFLTMMILTFDDDKEEVIEFVNLNLFLLFLTIFLFHGWKYSTHYFSFLDTSRKSTSSVLFLMGQALFDALNLVGFSLRFVLLMARLNIYDGVDDVLDSYYILFIDFDEDEYYLDTLPDIASFSYFDTDVQDDRSFLMEDESDLVIDFYTLYTVLWGKYVFYIAFVLEEFARVGLALFVTYLLMFEINAVNRSYNEENYLVQKRY